MYQQIQGKQGQWNGLAGKGDCPPCLTGKLGTSLEPTGRKDRANTYNLFLTFKHRPQYVCTQAHTWAHTHTYTHIHTHTIKYSKNVEKQLVHLRNSEQEECWNKLKKTPKALAQLLFSMIQYLMRSKVREQRFIVARGLWVQKQPILEVRWGHGSGSLVQ